MAAVAARLVLMSSRSHFGLALILAALATVGPFSIDTFLPAMGAIGAFLGAGPVEIQQALTVYLFCYGLMMLWHGAISDAVGRRPVILIAMALFALASIGCALAQNLTQLLVCRGLQGMCGGAGLIVGRAIIRDSLDGPPAQRLMSHVTMLFSLSPAIAPVVGGWLFGALGWQAIFVFMALIGAGLCAACWLVLPETLPPARRASLAPRSLLHNYGAVARQRDFQLLAAGVAFNFAGFFLYIPAAPVFLMRHLGLGPAEFLWMFGPAVSGIMLGAFLSGRLAGRRSARELVNLSYGLMATAAVLNLAYHGLFPPMLPWSVLPLAIYTTGMSIASPSITLLVLDIFPSLRGTASSMQGFAQTMMSSLVAGAIVPLLWYSPLALAAGMAGFLALGYAMIWLSRQSTGY